MKRVCFSTVCIVFVVIFGLATGALAQEKADAKGLGKTYEGKSLGYSMSYPGNWVYTSQAAHIVVFSPQKKAKDGDASVSIQNLNTLKVKGGRFKDVDAVIDDLVNQLRIAKEVKVYEPTAYTYAKGANKLTGKQLTAEYVVNNQRYKQMIVVVPRGTGEVIHVWSFTSPSKSYDGNLETARAMLNSWTIQ
jgi:hypothetical protein